MKPVFLSILLLSCLCCFSQVEENTALETQFNAVFKGLDTLTQRKLESLYNLQYGVALFTAFEVDTLNKDQLHKTQSVEIYDMDGKLMTYGAENPGMSLLRLKGPIDQLYVGLHSAFGDYLKVQRKGQAFTAHYKEESGGNHLKLKWEDAFSSTLLIPMNTDTVQLSTMKPAPGAEVYGKLNLTSIPYYEVDDAFKGGCIKKRLRIAFIFKSAIK